MKFAKEYQEQELFNTLIIMRGSLTLSISEPSSIDTNIDLVSQKLKLSRVSPLTKQILESAQNLYTFEFESSLPEKQFFQISSEIKDNSSLLRSFHVERVEVQEQKPIENKETQEKGHQKQLSKLSLSQYQQSARKPSDFIVLDQPSDSDEDKFIELQPEQADKEEPQEYIDVTAEIRIQERNCSVLNRKIELSELNGEAPPEARNKSSEKPMASDQQLSDQNSGEAEMTNEVDLAETLFKYYQGKDDGSTVFNLEKEPSPEEKAISSVSAEMSKQQGDATSNEGVEAAVIESDTLPQCKANNENLIEANQQKEVGSPKLEEEKCPSEPLSEKLQVIGKQASQNSTASAPVLTENEAHQQSSRDASNSALQRAELCEKSSAQKKELEASTNQSSVKCSLPEMYTYPSKSSAHEPILPHLQKGQTVSNRLPKILSIAIPIAIVSFFIVRWIL